MKRKAGIALLALAAGLAAAFPFQLASSNQEVRADIASIDDSQFPALTAVVNVLDPAGRPVPGLAATDFQAKVGDSPAPITNLQTAVDAQVSLAVVLAIDVSGSMSGDPLLQAQTAAKEFVLALSPQDTVALLTFSEGVSLVQDFTSDKAAATAAIDGLQAVGNTALYEATSQAVQKASQAASPRKVVILLSDGYDYGEMSTLSRDESIAQARAAGIPTFTVGLGADIDREYLTQLSQPTGARFLETPTAEGLTQLYGDIGNQLRSQYVLTLTSPVTDRSAPLQVDLTVTVGSATATASRVLPATEQVPPPPVVSLTGLTDGQEISAALTVGVRVQSGEAAKVTFIVDGRPVSEDSTLPFEWSLDPAVLTPGTHTIEIDAAGKTAGSGHSSLSFIVPAPAAGGGVVPAAPVLGVAALAVLLASVVYLVLRRRFKRVPRQVVEVRLRPWSSAVNSGNESLHELFVPEPEPEPARVIEEPQGKLIIASGPDAGKAFTVSSAPISIGSAGWCSIILPEEDGRVGPEEARAWVHQSKRLIFHRLTRLSVLAAEGTSGGWLVLQDGDEIAIGSTRLLFQLEVPPTEEERAVSLAIDDALRGLDQPSDDPASGYDDDSAATAAG